MSTNIDYWKRILKNPTEPYKKLFKSEKKYLISHIPKNSNVLDIGCGEGRNIQTILNITPHITGIDNDKKAVDDAKKKLARYPNVKILLADVLAIPFPNNTFDAVVLMMTLVNFEKNKAKALKEMSRVIKNDGKIIISVYSEDAFDTRMEMYRMVEAPIDRVEGTTVILSPNFGANISEQFSKEKITRLACEANLKIVHCEKIGSIAYICELKKDN